MILGAVVALSLTACPAKVPAWGVHDEASLPRHAQVRQLLTDARCRVYALTGAPLAVVRLDASGEPTRDFASAGALALEAPAQQLILDEAHDRLLTVGGTSGSTAAAVVVVRAWNLDGVPKRAFGKGGVLRFEVPGSAVGVTAQVRAVSFDEGALLLVAQVPSTVKNESAVYAVRISAEGAPETPVITPSFVAGVMAGGAPHLARVGTQGAWYFTSSGSTGYLARFDSHGRLDQDVGEQGVEKCPDIAYANALRTDGDGVILGGTAQGYRQILERRTGSGALDPAFGSHGQIFYKADPQRLEHVRDFVRTGAGVLSAFASFDPKARVSRLGLAAWRMDGRLDPTYGTGGVRWISRDAAVTDGNALTLDPFGRYLVALDFGAELLDQNLRSSVLRVEPPGVAPLPAVQGKPTPADEQEIWEYTDEKGVTTWVNSRDAVPEAYRKKARKFSQ